jgi:hypothetical protein
MKKTLALLLAIVAIGAAPSVLAQSADLRFGDGTFGTRLTTPVDQIPAYTREYGVPGTVYTLSDAAMVVRFNSVARAYTQTFYGRFDLQNGATLFGQPGLTTGNAGFFIPAGYFGAGLPAAAFRTPTYTADGCTYAIVNVINQRLTGADFVYNVTEVAAGTCIPTRPVAPIYVDISASSPNARQVIDNLGVMQVSPYRINAQLLFVDAVSNVPIDPPGGAIGNVPIIKSVQSVSVVANGFNGTTALIDIQGTASDARKFFAPPEGPVSNRTVDVGATLQTAIATTRNPNGSATGYAPVPSDCVAVTVTGPMAGVSEIYYGLNFNNVDVWSYTLTAADKLAPSVTFYVPADEAILGGTANIQIEVDGTTPLTPRVFTTQIVFRAGGCLSAPYSRTLVNGSRLTCWSYNGSQVLAPWVNANASYFKTRFYIAIAGSPTGASNVFFRLAEVKKTGATGPVKGVADYKPLPEGISIVGSRNIWLEDLLALWNGTTLADLENGNVSVEFLIGAQPVQAVASVYNKAIIDSGVALASYWLAPINTQCQ